MQSLCAGARSSDIFHTRDPDRRKKTLMDILHADCKNRRVENTRNYGIGSARSWYSSGTIQTDRTCSFPWTSLTPTTKVNSKVEKITLVGIGEILKCYPPKILTRSLGQK